MTRERNKWLLRLTVVLVVCSTVALYYTVGYHSLTRPSSSYLTPLQKELLTKMQENKIVESASGKLSGTRSESHCVNSTSDKLENVTSLRSCAVELAVSKSAPPERKTKLGNIKPVLPESNTNLVPTRSTATSSLEVNHTMNLNIQSLGKRFMLSLVYAEQLTNAFAHYNEFLVIASRLNFTGVEPFVHNSRMLGVCSLMPDPHTCFDLGLLINLDSFNSQLSTCFGKFESNTVRLDTPYMIKPMGDFLIHSYRKLIVVYFAWHMFVLPKDIHKSMDSLLGNLFSKQQDEPIIVNCRDIAKKTSLTRHIEFLLNKKEQHLETNITSDLDNSNFTVQDVFCVNRVSLSLEQLIDHLAGYLNTTLSHVSILFVSWQGKFTREFADWRTFDFHCKLPFTKVQFSEKVHHFADRFLQSVGLYKENFISVHIRFEKLFQFAYSERKDSQEKFYSCCMRRLELLLELLAKKNNLPLNNTLLLNDYGGFGTDSCRYQGRWSPHHLCEQQTNKSLALLNVSASEFNPRLFEGAPDNSGFASLVEEASLFSGRVLVAVGGGGYQGGVVSRYIDWHRNNTYKADELHYQLCIREKLNGLELDHQTC